MDEVRGTPCAANYVPVPVGKCRICGSSNLTTLYSLGNLYVSDFVKPEDVHNGIKSPLELEHCGNCSLIQLRHTAPQELLYSGHYWYRSSTSSMMREALRDITKSAEELIDLQPDDVVLDIGSNDGTLLRSYKKPCCKVGVEPASNMAKFYDDSVYLTRDFWGADGVLEDHLQCHGKAKVITAIGMMYDLEEPQKFINAIAKALHHDGIFIAQLMCLRNMLNLADVGNICHEHLEYYSLESLEYMLDEAGLEIFDIQTNAVNGESYRIYMCHNGGKHSIYHHSLTDAAWERIRAAYAQEACFDRPEYFADWFRRIQRNRNVCVDFIRSEAAIGKRTFVRGASTKGNTILQWYGLNSELIHYAIDASPEKHGKVTIGTDIKIISDGWKSSEQCDYQLVLPYGFVSEFVSSSRQWLAGGGRFIVPIPQFRLI